MILVLLPIPSLAEWGGKKRMPFVESTFDVVQVALLHIQQPIGHNSSIYAISINTERERERGCCLYIPELPYCILILQILFSFRLIIVSEISPLLMRTWIGNFTEDFNLERDDYKKPNIYWKSFLVSVMLTWHRCIHGSSMWYCRWTVVLPRKHKNTTRWSECFYSRISL